MKTFDIITRNLEMMFPKLVCYDEILLDEVNNRRSVYRHDVTGLREWFKSFGFGVVFKDKRPEFVFSYNIPKITVKFNWLLGDIVTIQLNGVEQSNGFVPPGKLKDMFKGLNEIESDDVLIRRLIQLIEDSERSEIKRKATSLYRCLIAKRNKITEATSMTE